MAETYWEERVLGKAWGCRSGRRSTGVSVGGGHSGRQAGLALLTVGDGESVCSEQESHSGVGGRWSEKGRASFPEIPEAQKP